MLTRIREPLPVDLQKRGYRMLEMMHGLTLPQQLDLACRVLLGALIAFRPEPSAMKAQHDAFETICDGLEVWLKDEIAEIRRPQPRVGRAAAQARPQPKVGYAYQDESCMRGDSPDTPAPFERWLLRRVAEAVEAGEVPADLLTELRKVRRHPRGGPGASPCRRHPADCGNRRLSRGRGGARS